MLLPKVVRIGKSGAAAAEYALILAIVGGGIVTASIALKGSISGALTKTALALSTNTPS